MGLIGFRVWGLQSLQLKICFKRAWGTGRATLKPVCVLPGCCLVFGIGLQVHLWLDV